MENNNKSKFPCLLAGILIICCSVTCLGVLAFMLFADYDLHLGDNDNREKVSENGTAVTSNTDGYSTDNIPSNDVEQIMIPEIDLALDALNLLKENNWNGSKNGSLPITIDDFDQNKLQTYIDYDIAGDEKLTIPASDEDLYLGSASESELQGILEKARQEYLDFLLEKGVAQKYVDEINNQTLPIDRINYHAENNPNSDWSRTEALLLEEEITKDYRKLVMHIYPVDIYNRVRILNNSRIFGTPNESMEYKKTLRDASLRLLTFHEMTHVLQQAYINVHLPSEYDKQSIKSLWDKADKNLVGVHTTDFFWSWGNEVYAKSNNHSASDESQAEGVAWEIMVDVYSLTDTQADALWDHYLGRLYSEMQNLDKVRQVFESSYPDYNPADFYLQLKPVTGEYSGVGSRTLESIAGRLIALPAYVGYLNPMKPEDAGGFWNALGN